MELFKQKFGTKQIKDKKGNIVAVMGHGRTKCQFCDEIIYHFNLERHQKAKKHAKNIEKFEKKHGMIVIENIGRLSVEEIEKQLSLKLNNK